MAAGAVLAKAAAMDVVAAVAGNALGTLLGGISRPAVAGRADQPLVLAGQGKLRRLVMIEVPRFPVERIVAVAALRRRAQRSHVVFVFMARSAGNPLCREAFVGMAGGALQCTVFAQQWEAGKIMVKTDLGFPIIGIVAPPAIGTQLAKVNVDLGMAGSAFGRELYLARWFDVAGLTLHAGMFTDQRKTGHRVVIEAGDLPAGGAVTPRAVGTVAAFMDIVCGVAADACDWRLGDLWRLLVAALALHGIVFAEQRELGHLIMVKAGLLPAASIVAARAVGSVLAFVHVILGMAGVAGAAGVLDRISRAVTART